MRDQLLDVEQLSCLAEAKIVIADWCENDNDRRLHSALAMRAPAGFTAAQLTAATGYDTNCR